MITATDLQQSYINLYKQLREYLWPFHTVELIAELEIECYSSFPQVNSLRNIYSRLKSEIFSEYISDDDEYRTLKDVFDKFDSTLAEAKDFHDIYAKIPSMREVTRFENK